MRMVLAAAGLLALTGPAAAGHRAELGIAGDAAEIRKVVAGRTCVSDGGDVLKFGQSGADASGTFEHAGMPPGRYAIGYASLLVERNSELHGHIVVVWPDKVMLHFGGQAYRCGSADAE